MAEQKSHSSSEQPRRFTPSFPFFLVRGDGKPVVGSDLLEAGDTVIEPYTEADVFMIEKRGRQRTHVSE